MAESEKPASRFSRRSFIKTAGAGAAAAGVSAQAQEKGPEFLGPDAAAITLSVNGVLRKVTVEPRVTLLRALRNELEITGAKEVCDRGGCGACTVLMDGRIVNACMLMAWDAVGHEITTVESFGTPEKLSPVQAAFVDCDGYQCGFCTPGMVVSCTALLKKNPNPSLDEIKAGLAGNLCRCGTYGRIFESVQKAAKTMAAAKPGAGKPAAGKPAAKKGE
jgi:aerobic-type carbon monoxide dehydrogenase small subunit (CoxS/CutS family)